MYRELKSYSWLAKVKQKTLPIVIMESVRRDDSDYSAAAYRRTTTGASAQAVQNLLWR